MKASDFAAILSRVVSDYFERPIVAMVDGVDDGCDVVSFDPALSEDESREFFAALKAIAPSMSIAPLAGATGDA